MEFYYLKKKGMVEWKYTPGSILYKADKQYLAQKENKKTGVWKKTSWRNSIFLTE